MAIMENVSPVRTVLQPLRRGQLDHGGATEVSEHALTDKLGALLRIFETEDLRGLIKGK